MSLHNTRKQCTILFSRHKHNGFNIKLFPITIVKFHIKPHLNLGMLSSAGNHYPNDHYTETEDYHLLYQKTQLNTYTYIPMQGNDISKLPSKFHYDNAIWVVIYFHQPMSYLINGELGYRTNKALTHWGQVMHICIGKLTIIGSDNGLSPGQHQAII